VVRVGIVAKKYARVLFHNFLNKFKNIRKEDIIEYQGGLIPQYDPQIKTQRNNVYIVGDAACHVKATTGGGIISGLKAGESLAYALINNKSYNPILKKKIGNELYLNLKARKIMDRFNTNDWNKLIGIMNSNEAKNILATEQRDCFLKMALKIIMKKPQLLCFLKYII
jgi:flavin-dependent dehydrogenase